MTRACSICGNSDRLLKTTAGILLCINTERCDNDLTAQRAQLVLNQLTRDQTDNPRDQAIRRQDATADVTRWLADNREALAQAFDQARQ